MAADLHIHAMKDVTEHDLKVFFSHTLGSKWFDLTIDSKYDGPGEKAVAKSPSVWICEVSWLKAALFEDAEEFIPDLASEISDLIGEELPIIDDSMIKAVELIFKNMKEHEFYNQADEAPVLDFLKAHKGLRAFTVSW